MKDVISPRRALVVLVLSIFFVELAIMVVFLVAPPLDPIAEIIVESTALIIGVTPILYWFAIRPLYEQITRRQDAVTRLETLNAELDQQVAERIRELEKRAAQLQTISEVARTIAGVQDLNSLLPEIARLVSGQFGFYHTGIFLVDEVSDFAVLKAANSPGGRRMLNRQHRLAVDVNSIVGYAVSRGEPRIAPVVELDALYFNNPELPETRAEMALPLRVGRRIIGAIDVQSVETDAFSQEDISLLATLADQIAIAIENARLFDEARRALSESRDSFEKYVKQDWRRFVQQARYRGFVFDGKQLLPLEHGEAREQIEVVAQSGSLITIPIKLRGQTIGALDVRSKSGPRDWTPGEITLLEAASERAALALENARLLESSQQRAARERAIGEISTRIGYASNLEAVLQAAVEELGRKIGATEVTIELGDGEN